MSQHLSSAIASISHEIERLTEIRNLLSDMNSESDAIEANAPATKRAAKKSAAKTAVPAKRRGRPPVSEETRQKMADARRAFFARRDAPAKKTAAKKGVAKRAQTTKSAAKKSSAKKTSEAVQS